MPPVALSRGTSAIAADRVEIPVDARLRYVTWWGHSVVRVKDGDVHGHSVAAAEASGQQAA